MNNPKTMNSDVWVGVRSVRYRDYDESCIDAAYSFIRENIYNHINFQVIHDGNGFRVVKTK